MRIKKYYKLVRVDYADSEYFRITNVDTVSGSISFENMSGKNIEYSTDGVNWTTLSLPSAAAVTIDNVAPGANVYLRGTNSTIGSSSNVKHITADFSHNIGGNICSLLDKTNFSTMTSITTNYAFAYLFYQDTKLISAGNVNFGNVTTLGNYACYSIYNGCTLTTGSDLSNVTSLGKYACANMYNGCTHLQTVIAPNVDTWDTSKFSDWVYIAGDQAATPKQMIFQTQELLDLCPSGSSGYGSYTKVLA